MERRLNLPQRHIDNNIHTQRFSADLWEVPYEIVSNPRRLNKIARTICKELKLDIVRGFKTPFNVDGKPIAVTAGLTLEQSLYSYHSWVKELYLGIDGHTCSQDVDLSNAKDLIIEHYQPGLIGFKYWTPDEPESTRFHRKASGIYTP